MKNSTRRGHTRVDRVYVETEIGRCVANSLFDLFNDARRFELVNVVRRQELEPDLDVVLEVFEPRQARADPGVDRSVVRDQALVESFPKERSVSLIKRWKRVSVSMGRKIVRRVSRNLQAAIGDSSLRCNQFRPWTEKRH